MHYEHHGQRRMPARPWLVVGAALACAGAAVGISMTAAHAEARSTTAVLTLTGMVDQSCPVDVGGTTAYVAPGGTVSLEASLVGASLKLPLLGSIPLDAKHIASFVDTVTVDGSPNKLHGGDSLALRDVTDATTVEWRATAVTLLPGIAGGITVPLNANNVSLPAGAELDWTGQIIPSANTRCGVAVALPTVRASVGTHTVTVPGVGVTVSLPGRPGSSSASHGTSTAGPPTSAPTSSQPSGSAPAGPTGTHSASSPPGGSAPSHPAAVRPPGSDPDRHRMPAERPGNTAHPDRHGPAAPATGPATQTSQRGETAVPIGNVRQTPAADNNPGKDIAAPGTQRLWGGSLPALLAIAAILALSVVSTVYVRQYLLGERRR